MVEKPILIRKGLLPDGIFGTPSLVEARLAAIVESSDDAIVSKDLNGIVQTWNQGAERLFGYTAEEMIGRPMLTVIPPERHAEEDMILSRMQRGEKVDHFQTVRVRKDGSRVDVSVTVSPVRDEAGNIVGASKIARDITDLIRADTLNAHLAAIIASSDDAIVSKDLNGVVQSWNRGAERLFGYLSEEMVGNPINILLPQNRQDEETRILERLRRGERIDHFETVRVRKDGREIHVSVTISPIRDRTGHIIGASKVARDISERKMFEAATAAFTQELEQRVRERTADLEEAHREMEAFTYSIAHDLRAPFRAIVSTSRMIAEDYGPVLPREACAMLDRQVAAAMQLSHFVDDLLTYSRLGKDALKIAPVNISELAREVAAGAGSDRHTFQLPEGQIMVQGDRSLLYLLLQNLFDNARKFSPKGGEIEFSRTGPVFFVRDRGIGFDMAYAEKIFMPFERLIGNAEIPGSGIGLANAKRIVERHKGSIWANSVPNEGTTIYFTIP